MAINKFILGTKQFFQDKPVRIVVALLLISGIMTGVAFGIIALLNAFKQPTQCANDDIRYDGKSEESRGINANGLCGPKCDESTEEVCPTYDNSGNITSIKCVNNCEVGDTYIASNCNIDSNAYCKLDCSGNILQKTPYYDSGYQKWYCGQSCPRSTNDSICNANSFCFKSDVEGLKSVSNNQNMCQQNENPIFYCNKNDPNSAQYVHCADTSNCEKTPDGNYYCNNVSYCGKNEYKLCNNDNECNTVYGATCQSVSETDLSALKTTFGNKKINSDNIKICYSGSEKDYTKVPQNLIASCCSMNEIGYDGSNSKCCPGKKIGINSTLQCKDDTCIDTVCANSWQEKDSSNKCYSGTDSITKDYLGQNGYCCPDGNAIGGVGKDYKGCCIFATTSIPEVVLPNGSIQESEVKDACMNYTPNNLNDLKNFYKDLNSTQVQCNSTLDCSSLNSSLKEKISANSTDSNSPYYNMSNSRSELEYSTFICSDNKFKQSGKEYVVDNSTGEKYCQLHAGYVDPKQKIPYNFYISGNGYSSAWSNQRLPWTIDGPPSYTNEYSIRDQNGILGCVNVNDYNKISNGNESKDELRYWWRPEPGQTGQAYYGKAQYNLKNNNQNASINKYECEKAIQLKDSIQIESVLESNKTSDTTATCDYLFRCDNNDQNLRISGSSDKLKSIPFNEITYSDLEDTDAKILTVFFSDKETENSCKSQSRNIYQCMNGGPYMSECPCPYKKSTTCTPYTNSCCEDILGNKYELGNEFSLDNNENQVDPKYNNSFIQTTRFDKSNPRNCTALQTYNNQGLLYNGQMTAQYDGTTAKLVDTLDGRNLCSSDKHKAIVNLGEVSCQ